MAHLGQTPGRLPRRWVPKTPWTPSSRVHITEGAPGAHRPEREPGEPLGWQSTWRQELGGYQVRGQSAGPPAPGHPPWVPPLRAPSPRVSVFHPWRLPVPLLSRPGAALTDLSPPDLGQVTLEAPQGSEASSVLPDYGLGQTTRLCFHICKRGVKITPESQGTVSTEEVLSEGCLSCDLLYEQRGAVIWPRTHSYWRQGQASFRPGPAPWRPCQPLCAANGTGGPGPITKGSYKWREKD